jgi:ssDNA-binding Zn-finger/Zn-ribbon topoisomerase 1
MTDDKEKKPYVCSRCRQGFHVLSEYQGHAGICQWMNECPKCKGKLVAEGRKKVCSACGWSRDLQ